MSQKQRKGTSVQATQNIDGLQTRIEQIEEYSPYPSGEFLHQLHQINPELVPRIIAMSEQEQSHRHQLQKEQLQETKRINQAFVEMDNRQLDLLSRGQWFGLVLAVGLVVLAGFAIYWREPTVAGIAITAIVGILVVYVLRQRPNHNNLPQ